MSILFDMYFREQCSDIYVGETSRERAVINKTNSSELLEYFAHQNVVIHQSLIPLVLYFGVQSTREFFFIAVRFKIAFPKL